MKIQEINWSILAGSAGVILFGVSVYLILSKNSIFQEILSGLIIISTGKKLF
ncbi:MAG: hypothetical protein WC619_05955 [Patescibacteria group bacterium]